MLSDSNLRIMKICTKCKTALPIEWFGKNKNSKDGLNRYCKECNKNSSAQWRAKNPDNNAGARIKYLYGISMSEYSRMLESQNHRCAICGTEKDSLGRRFAVDHCHETGRVRGLLCFKCNTGLGKLNTIELLEKAKIYLDNMIEKDICT